MYQLKFGCYFLESPPQFVVPLTVILCVYLIPAICTVASTPTPYHSHHTSPLAKADGSCRLTTFGEVYFPHLCFNVI